MKRYTIKTIVKDDQGNRTVVGEVQTDNLMVGMVVGEEYAAGKTRNGEPKFIVAYLN